MLPRATFITARWTMPAFMTILYRQVRLVGLPAGLSRLTSRFDMDEEGVDYAEIADLLLDPDTSGLRSKLLLCQI